MFKNTNKEYTSGNFTFHDIDPDNECNFDEKEVKRIEKERRLKKKDLHSYFAKNNKINGKLKVTNKKESKKTIRLKTKEEELSNIKKNKIYVYRDIKFIEVKDFISYLNDNYVEIDEISKEVLSDENFHAWLSKESEVFEESIKQFKEIKDKIEKK